MIAAGLDGSRVDWTDKGARRQPLSAMSRTLARDVSGIIRIETVRTTPLIDRSVEEKFAFHRTVGG
jgi:hypothetical protein